MSSNDSFRTRMGIMIQGKNSLKETVITGLSELLGTAILVFLGCMGCVPSSVPSHLQITLNFGLSVMIVIQIFGHISHAHVNPAISAGAVVLGKKSLLEASIYILCQLTGGIIGYGMLKIVTPQSMLIKGEGSNTGEENDFCVTHLQQDISAIQGLTIEAIATAVLMLLACAIWDKRNEKNTDSTAIKFGLAVTALATAAGPYTGCSMNPARSLAPAFWNNEWYQHWIYWFGPISGSVLAAFIYRTIFGKKAYHSCDTTIPETIVLNSRMEPEKN